MIDVEMHGEFLKRMGNRCPYLPKAIFPSEMYAFFIYAYDFNENDVIVESGSGYGGSTFYLSKLFPKTKIYSVDNDLKYKQMQSLIKKFEDNKNVELIKGDSMILLPSIIRNARACQRVAVLIDGPKGWPAVKLAKACLTMSPAVRFAAVHDLSDELAKLGVFNTRCQAWFDEAFYLNRDVGMYATLYPRGPGLTFFFMDIANGHISENPAAA